MNKNQWAKLLAERTKKRLAEKRKDPEYREKMREYHREYKRQYRKRQKEQAVTPAGSVQQAVGHFEVGGH